MYSVTSFLLANTTAGLLALLGLAVPVAIHLWNRRPGHTVQVGSVRWLAATANRRLRNLQLEQVWLLLLRAAVLVLLALAVAGPLWQRRESGQPVRGVVLLAPEALRPEVLPALRPTIDSLRKQGFTLRLFVPGFRAVSGPAWGSSDSLAKLTASATTSSTTAALLTAPPDNYWHRAQQAADSFPDQPVRIVAGTALRHFTGPQCSALPARLTWQPVPLPDSSVWLAEAALSGADTLRLMVGRSREEATTFRTVVRQLPPAAGQLTIPGLPDVQYQPGKAGQLATLRQPGKSAVAVLPGSLQVVLYTDATHAESGRYVRAALQAAAIGLNRGLEIRSVSAAASFTDSARPDWLFWLSEKPIPANWQAQVKRGAQLWQEASGTSATVQTELDLVGLAAAPPVPITRLDTTQPAPRTALLWHDGAGRPVLTHQTSGAGGIYRLHTRLQPTWSGLPDSPALPELLLQLLRPATPPTYATHDARQLDAQQLISAMPSDTSSAASAQNSFSQQHRSDTQTTDLRAWAVLAALLLFGLERWLASRRSTLTPSISAV